MDRTGEEQGSGLRDGEKQSQSDEDGKAEDKRSGGMNPCTGTCTQPPPPPLTMRPKRGTQAYCGTSTLVAACLHPCCLRLTGTLTQETTLYSATQL